MMKLVGSLYETELLDKNVFLKILHLTITKSLHDFPNPLHTLSVVLHIVAGLSSAMDSI